MATDIPDIPEVAPRDPGAGPRPEPVAGPRERPSATDRLRDDLRAVLPSWVVARILVAASWFLARAVAESSVPGGRTLHQLSGLGAWDGGFYRDIAVIGYPDVSRETVRFFPLFPLIGRWLAAPFGLEPGVTLIIVANLAALVAGVVVRRLMLAEGRDPATAERAVWALNLFPSAFVLVWGYAEGLYVSLAVATFLLARRDRYGWAAALAFGAALTRPVGLFLAAPLAIEALRTWRGATNPGRALRAAAVAAPVVATAAYLAYIGRLFGDPLAPMNVQDEYRTPVDPLTRLVHGFGDLVGPQRFADGLHIPFVLAFLALLVVVARRWPASYTVYAALVLLVAISAENLNSVERYALNAFPLLFALADVTGTPRRERLGLAVCGSGLLALSALAWLAVYVP
jgi:hypothetical protein